MSVDDTRPTSTECPDTSDSPAAAVTSSLLTDDVISDDHVTKSERSSKSHSVQIHEPPVTDLRHPTKYAQQTAVVVSEEKRGPLHRAIPSMPLPLAVIACVLNIILPGTGCRYFVSVSICDTLGFPRVIEMRFWSMRNRSLSKSVTGCPVYAIYDAPKVSPKPGADL